MKKLINTMGDIIISSYELTFNKVDDEGYKTGYWEFDSSFNLLPVLQKVLMCGVFEKGICKSFIGFSNENITYYLDIVEDLRYVVKYKGEEYIGKYCLDRNHISKGYCEDLLSKHKNFYI